jgi:hypothetical protein
MNRLIGDLVDVASIEAGRLALTREVGNPGHVVTEVGPKPFLPADPSRFLSALDAAVHKSKAQAR